MVSGRPAARVPTEHPPRGPTHREEQLKGEIPEQAPHTADLRLGTRQLLAPMVSRRVQRKREAHITPPKPLLNHLSKREPLKVPAGRSGHPNDLTTFSRRC